MADDPPAPLVPPDADMRGLPFMPLDVVRLMDSDLFALSTGEEFKAAAAAWCKSWLQLPAGSLPDDDRVLAHLTSTGARWRKVKAMALRGFVKCSDGRLYHPVVCEKVAEAWQMRLRQRERSARGNAARWGDNRHGDGDSNPTGIPAGIAKGSPGDAQHHRKGQGQGQKEEGSVPNGTGGQAPPSVVDFDPQKPVFARGKQVLGKSSGGQITKLLRRVDGDCGRAMDLLNLAAGKSDAGEYIGGFLRGNGEGKADDVLAETTRLYRDLGIE